MESIDIYSHFQSTTDLDFQREETRKARQLVLDEAKKKYDKAEAKKQRAAKQGEGTWMLDSVSKRIEREEKSIADKHKKKHKKEKKKKKKKKKSHSSTSGSESDEESQWIEKTSSHDASGKVGGAKGPIKGPMLQRENWMEMPLEAMPLTSRDDVRAAIEKEKKEAEAGKVDLNAPGQHVRELNPYWKDGGTGLPEEELAKRKKEEAAKKSVMIGDGGLTWLRTAYGRFKAQAEEEGRKLEEVVAERWGSLSKLNEMIKQAEDKNRSGSDRPINRHSSYKDRTRYEDQQNRDKDRTRYEDQQNRDKMRDRGDRNRDRKDGEKMSGGNDRHNDGRHSNYHSRRRAKSDDSNSDSSDSGKDSRKNMFKKPSDLDDASRSSKNKDNGRRTFKRPSDNDEDHDDRLRSKAHSENRDKGIRKGFKRPSDCEDEDIYSSKSIRDNPMNRDSNKKTSCFVRPDDDCDRDSEKKSSRFLQPDDKISRRSPDRYRDKQSRSGNRDKDSPERHRHSDKPRYDSRRDDKRLDVPRWKKKQNSPSPPPKKVSDSSKERGQKKRGKSSESSSDSSSDSDSDLAEEVKVEEALPPPKVMTEEELNDLAAKILRAEIMDDDDLVASLQAKLKAARETREASKSGTSDAPDFSCHKPSRPAVQHNKGDKSEDEDVVVLTKTGRGNMAMPLAGAGEAGDMGGQGGKKKRKKNVTTHDDKGERTKFFDNDDNFDLKTLVEQEKRGSAEDQNAMFSRLAGKSNDRDLDVDDMFVSKAARKQNEENTFTKDRASAIFEHKKLTSAMEKCQRCFEKVPKHLIVAIGSKSYLALPAHRSLTEGHCLIVPMQHVVSATALDEDVWQEMQLFRKCLVEMFTSEDQDCVVMETVMHIKHFPHTALEVIPLDREIGDMSPIFFKKAIEEAGPEWSDNKKLIDLSKKDVKRAIPKGFPYFAVDFGLQGGFAKVIEDEATFTPYFGREIVGGMIDAEPTLWRKPHKESFENQKQKVLQFDTKWKPYDWTLNA